MYDELVKRMWECASGQCFNCSQYTPTTNASVCQKELMKQAADAIKELIKDRDNWKITAKEEREMYWHWFDNYQRDVPRWIPVTERLPENGHFVLTLRWRKDIGIGYLTNYTQDGSICWVVDHDSYNRLSEGAITHWMPLPESPKEET